MSEEYTQEFKAKRNAFLARIPDDKEMAFAQGLAEGFVAGTEAVLRMVETGEITREMLESEESDEHF